MSIKPLDHNIVTQIRSSFAIKSVSQCVSELVLNSLDAESTAIGVRVNLRTFKIQVIDNGRGISQANLQLIGQRYMTSRCDSVTALKCSKTYGFRGEAIASICRISKVVKIQSRVDNDDVTYEKVIKNIGRGDVFAVNSRPSCGTTITIEGFLHNLPVRQRCVKSTELDNVRSNLEALIIINPKVSFTLRDDSINKIILNSSKRHKIIDSFKDIHRDIREDRFMSLKVSKKSIRIEGFFHKDLHINKKLQYVYVNGRPVNCTQIVSVICNSYAKIGRKSDDKKKKHPIFVVNVKCPNSDVDLELESAKTLVLFKNSDTIINCVKKLMSNIFGDYQELKKSSHHSQEIVELGVSNIYGAVRKTATKRKRKPKSFDDCEDFLSKPPKKMAKMEVKSNRIVAADRNENPHHLTINTIHPENEETGKDFLMTLFLRSVQVYSEEIGSICDDDLDDLSLRVQEATTQHSIARYDPTETFNQPIDYESKVSIGVQTENQQSPFRVQNRRRSMQRYVSDYDFDFSNLAKIPEIKEKPFSFDKFGYNKSPQKRKPLFDLHKMDCASDFTFCLNDIGNFTIMPAVTDGRTVKDATTLFEARLSPIPKATENPKTYLKDMKRSTFVGCETLLSQSKKSKALDGNAGACRKHQLCQKCEQEIIDDDKSKRERTIIGKSRNSPDFEFAKPLANNIFDFKRNKGAMNESFQHEDDDRNLLKSPYFFPEAKKTEPPDDKSPVSKNPIDFEKSKLNETITSHYFSQTHHPDRNIPEISGEEIIEDEGNEPQNDSNFIMTVPDTQDRLNLIQSDLNFEKNFNQDLAKSLNSTVSDQNKSCERIHWVQYRNDHGVTIYVNTETGMSSMYRYPKNEKFTFDLTSRLNCVPKGMSPILKTVQVQEIDPITKETLHNAIVESYQDDLLLVKWRNYCDPNEFFNEIYAEKSRNIERAVPNISKKGTLFSDQTVFTKDLFKNLEIIGQVDCKFIAALGKTEDLLILFDQHAVHERVKLEALLESMRLCTSVEGYDGASFKIDRSITMFIPQQDLELLRNRNNESSLKSLGLIFDSFANGINVFEVPLCVYNKSLKAGFDLIALIQTLIREIIDSLRENNGILVKNPKIIQDIINSEACRTAVKFGDKLTKTECIKLLDDLSRCVLPFQCAHGRPTLAPIISLRNCVSQIPQFCSKPNLAKFLLL